MEITSWTDAQTRNATDKQLLRRASFFFDEWRWGDDFALHDFRKIALELKRRGYTADEVIDLVGANE